MTDSPIPVSGSGWTRSRAYFLLASGIGVVAVLVFTREVLLPFILATITAYVLTPAVSFCERRARLPRSLAIISVYAVTLGTLYAAIAGIAPRLFSETQGLAHEAPAMARRLVAEWAPVIERRAHDLFPGVGEAEPEPAGGAAAFRVEKGPDGSMSVELGAGVDIVQEGPKVWRVRPARRRTESFSIAAIMSEALADTAGYVRRNAFEVVRIGQVVVAQVTRSIFLMFMTLMVAAYLMYTREQILDFFRSLPPPRARLGFDRFLFRVDRGLAGVVRGQLIIMVVNGLLSAVGFWLFGLKYWPLLALVAAVMSIVPIFGSILSSVPVVMVGLTQNFWTALWVLLWILGIHQVEANLLNPKIIGVAAKIHPVLVIFSLLVGEHFFGLWGALLAVPTLSVLQSLFNHFRFESLPDTPPDSVIIQTTRVRSQAALD
jgi:predicted PurR-regulated permease PerM